MTNSITGVLFKLMPTETFSGKSKRSIVIQYGKNFLCLDAWNDLDQIALLKEGDTLSCTYSVKSREYNGKYYTNASLISFNSDTKRFRNEADKALSEESSKTELNKEASLFNDDLPF